jgi:hypothetical protein
LLPPLTVSVPDVRLNPPAPLGPSVIWPLISSDPPVTAMLAFD